MVLGKITGCIFGERHRQTGTERQTKKQRQRLKKRDENTLVRKCLFTSSRIQISSVDYFYVTSQSPYINNKKYLFMHFPYPTQGPRKPGVHPRGRRAQGKGTG